MLGVQTCALPRSEEHTSELQSHDNIVCRLLLEKNDGMMRYRKGVGGSEICRYANWPGLVATQVRLPPRFAMPEPTAILSMFRIHVFFFKDAATPEIYPLPLPDALPI